MFFVLSVIARLRQLALLQRLCAIWLPFERVEHSVVTRRVQLEHRATAALAACHRCAVQIARPISDQPGVLLHAGRSGAGGESTGSNSAGAGQENGMVGKRPRSLGSATGRYDAGESAIEEFGFRGLFDRRRGKPSPKRLPVVEKVLRLYRSEGVP